MRTLLATLLLGLVVTIAGVPASAQSSRHDVPTFYGDGFDNATCADLPRCR